ncbi:hypothetical protein NSPZN2_10285 [Nitrospira defluvii]|uniref:Uncharacterized protein n=1 Tax=Nitrospira defluvii TaxID=330214 RepID=A0ABM8QE51_9BACT|nr:hypothetical protein NSPZN2_10285 [Nitrospira defluvii]
MIEHRLAGPSAHTFLQTGALRPYLEPAKKPAGMPGRGIRELLGKKSGRPIGTSVQETPTGVG